MVKTSRKLTCELFAVLALAVGVLTSPAKTQEPDPIPDEATSAAPVDEQILPGYHDWTSSGDYGWCQEQCYSAKCWGAYPFMGPSCRWHSVTVPRLTAHYWGYAEEFCERPFGTYARAAINTQINNGLVAQLVLYRYDFRDPTVSYDDAAKLRGRGHYQLVKIVDKLKRVMGPLVIEPSGDDDLDEERRQFVIARLDDLEFSFPEESVVIGRPPAGGMSGEEAFVNYQNLIMQTEHAGAFTPRLEERSTISFGSHADSEGPAIGRGN